jgi:hypothetical protein
MQQKEEKNKDKKKKLKKVNQAALVAPEHLELKQNL